MELNNFKLVRTTGTNELNWEYFAEVDVTTRPFPFFKTRTERRVIHRKFGLPYHFVDTGKWTPGMQAEC